MSLFHKENDNLDFNFSEGFLIHGCGSLKPMKVENEQIEVFDVGGVDGPVMLKFPGIETVMSVEISPGGPFIFGGGRYSFYIWIQSDEEPSLYEVFFHEVLFHRNSKSIFRSSNVSCCFSNDSKVAVVSYDTRESSYVIDLDTGNSQDVDFSGLAWSSKVFCVINYRVLISANDHAINFFDMDSGLIIDCSYQRYLRPTWSRQTIKLSPKEDMLAFPDGKSDMMFLRLSIPPDPLLADIKREAVVRHSALKRFSGRRNPASFTARA